MPSLRSSPLWVVLLLYSSIATYVRPVPLSPSTILTVTQQATANRQTIESLVPRVERLEESFRVPVPEGEDKERERREALER